MSAVPLPAPAKSTRIQLFNFRTPQMRAFHLSWLAFFICFFAWFAIAPLMKTIRKELSLTPNQIGNIIIASVAGTIFARLFIGWLCERIGPRLSYTWLLIVGSIPVMLIGLSHSYTTFLMFRLAIGAIGASFVITQYHTSIMFAPNCVGTANATTAGWGNMGGGVAQSLMPLVVSLIAAFGANAYWGWRIAMIIPGIGMILTGIAYCFLTQDAPGGNLADLRAAGREAEAKKAGNKGPGSFMMAASDIRVWALALIYAASFGIELTIHNTAGLYFIDIFKMGDKPAGMVVGAFGLLAIFARTLGGYLSDKMSVNTGLTGRKMVLGACLLVQGLLLIVFSRMGIPWLAVTMMILFGLFVHMTCGATYAVIPFVNPKAVGSVAGIVGAGGNLGAVLAGLLFKGSTSTWSTSLLWMGIVVAICSGLVALVRFAPDAERAAELPLTFGAGVVPA